MVKIMLKSQKNRKKFQKNCKIPKNDKKNWITWFLRCIILYRDFEPLFNNFLTKTFRYEIEAKLKNATTIDFTVTLQAHTIPQALHPLL